MARLGREKVRHAFLPPIVPYTTSMRGRLYLPGPWVALFTVKLAQTTCNLKGTTWSLALLLPDPKGLVPRGGTLVLATPDGGRFGSPGSGNLRLLRALLRPFLGTFS